MNRREALSRVALILGGTVVGGAVFLEGCQSGADKSAAAAAADVFDASGISYLDEVAETIIPATSTPGAKAAKVGEFMKTMVTDCYEEKDQKVFKEGIAKIEEASNKKFNKGFIAATPEQRKELLTEIDKEAKAYGASKKPEDPNHYFRLMKELTLLGYFTSEPGATKALRYVAVPGRYEGCIPYKKGDKAWAT
jgi:hypothetical protein